MAAIFAFLKSALGTCIKSDRVEFALTELWLTPEALLNEQTGESTFCNLKRNWLFFGWSWGLVTLSYLKYKNPKKLWFHDYKLCGPSPLCCTAISQGLAVLYSYLHVETFSTIKLNHSAKKTWIWALEEPGHWCTKPDVVPISVPYF